MEGIPALFSGPMVRALLEGRKTQTRRLAMVERKNRHVRDHLDRPCVMTVPSNWTKVQPGALIWVRETLQMFNREPPTAQYAATITGVLPPDGQARHICGAAYWTYPRRVMPAIHMPRWASRLTLEVTENRLQPLREITEADAKAEGVDAVGVSYVMAYSILWNQLNADRGSWQANPKVVALTFKVHTMNIDTFIERRDQLEADVAALKRRGPPEPGCVFDGETWRHKQEEF